MGFFFVVLAFFLPGYLISLLLPRVRGLSERIGLSIATSISFGVVVSVVFAVVRLPLAEAFFISSVIVSIILAMIARKKLSVIREEWRDAKKKEKAFVAAIFFLSILAGVFIALPHKGYPWAIHADEWWQIGTVQNVIEGKPLNTHPYLFNEFSNHKPGFSSYIAMVSRAAGIDPVEGWPLMPAINMFLVSFVGSLLLFGRTKRFSAGIALPVFLVALRSSAYSLGWWFFVPSIFALFFTLVLFLSSSLWTKNLREFFWACLVFGALALVYFPFAILSFLCFLPLFLKDLKERWMKLSMCAGLLLLAAGGIYFGVSISPYREFWRIASDISLPSFLLQSEIVQAFFIPLSATFHFAGTIGFFSTVPLLLFTLGIIGFFSLRSDRWAEGVRWGILWGTAIVLLGTVTGVSFLVFYQRSFYFLGIMIALSAAMGIVWITGTIRLFWDNRQLPAAWRSVVVFFFAATIVLFLFNGYFILPAGAGLYELVNRDDLAALRWLKENKYQFNGMAVVSNQSVGTILTPFTRLSSKVSFLTSQNAGALINPAGLMVEEEGKCENKETMLVDLGAGIVYAKKPQECPFLKEVYRNPSVFIYLYHAGK